MSGSLRKGDRVWTPIIDGSSLAQVTIVKVIRHKGETQFCVEVRADPDLVLAMRPKGALYRTPPRGWPGR